jgi:hypothetical protein
MCEKRSTDNNCSDIDMAGIDLFFVVLSFFFFFGSINNHPRGCALCRSETILCT